MLIGTGTPSGKTFVASSGSMSDASMTMEQVIPFDADGTVGWFAQRYVSAPTERDLQYVFFDKNATELASNDLHDPAAEWNGQVSAALVGDKLYTMRLNSSTAYIEEWSGGTQQGAWSFAATAEALGILENPSGTDVYFLARDDIGALECVRCNSSMTIQSRAWLLTHGVDWYSPHYGNTGAVDSSGNFYVPSTVSSSPRRGYISKYNSSGTELWTKRYYVAVDSDVYFRGIAISPDGSSYLVAIGELTDYNVDGPVVFTINQSTGAVLNARYPDKTNSDWSDDFLGVAVTNDGDIYTAINISTGGDAVLVQRWNSTLSAPVWSRKISRQGGQLFGTRRLYLDPTEDRLVIGTRTTGDYNQLWVLPTDGTGTGSYTLNSITFDYASHTPGDAAATVTVTTDSTLSVSTGTQGTLSSITPHTPGTAAYTWTIAEIT